MLQTVAHQKYEMNIEQLRTEIERSLGDAWQLENSDPLHEMCRYAIYPVGKLIRPLLLVDACLMVGEVPQAILPAAVGIEYAHVASLVHDDIIDKDPLRRGRNALHHHYGMESALLAGDALLFQTFWALAECQGRGVPAERVVQAIRIYAAAGSNMCQGQVLEGQVAGDLTCDLAVYTRIVQLKTASLFRCAVESGAVLGGGSNEQIAMLADYGERLGILFQIIDDLLSYTGEAATLGKSVVSDLRNKRLTLPIIFAYQTNCLDIRHRIEQLFDDEQCNSGEDHNRYIELLDILKMTSAIEKTKVVAEEQACAALAVLYNFPPSASRQRFESYIHWGLARRA
jgi:geranylgeranyl pyrophosphate synthase